MNRVEVWEEELSGSSVLVTGASGFIGKALISKLLRIKAEVHAFVRPGVSAQELFRLFPGITIHCGNIRDLPQVIRAVHASTPHYLFHACVERQGSSSGDFDSYYQTNVKGAENLIAALTGGNLKRLIILGSSAEYGSIPIAMQEDMECRASCLHGRTKAEATQLFLLDHQGQRIPTTVLRIFYVYGPGDYREKLVPTIVSAVKNGSQVLLTGPGYMRDYVYLDDVVAGCFRAATSQNTIGQIINIGTGIQTSNEDLLKLISTLSKREIEVRPYGYPASPWDSFNWVADTRKCEELLSWKPSIPLAQGLRNIMNL